MNDDKPEPTDAPASSSDDRKANMPFGSRRTTQYAEDAQKEVADDHGKHALPDIEPESDER